MSARFRLRALLTLIVIGASLFAFAKPAAASSDEDYFINAINQIRAGRGLGTLTVNAQLTAVGRSWSQLMASDGTLAHNPNLGGQISGWRTLGENVGTGSNDASIESAFENSPHHFENMVDPSFTQIGVGVVQDSTGTYWVTEDFEQPKNAPAAAPAPHTSAPKPAPRPAPKPATAPRPAPAPVHAAPVHAAATAAPAPAPAPATTVATAAPTTVPLAVLGTSAERAPVDHPLGLPNPFTAANLTGLVALVILGASMAVFTRVHGRVARTA
jgi:Cysteine-rich secretory protein family